MYHKVDKPQMDRAVCVYFTPHYLPPLFHTWVKKEGVARDYIQLLLIKLCCTTLVNEMTHSTSQGILILLHS